jgi:photosystem II stability/assembly factor-like uncharacterized protein
VSYLRPLLVTAVAALALAGCGADEPAARAPDRPAHVHGVGVDPADGSVVLGTHHGLYRSAGGDAFAPVGDASRDLMGLTVVGPGRLLASGHRTTGPEGSPHLGVIESTDGGRTWRDVALRGRVDLHVLRAAGRRVYAFDSLASRLLVSDDGGRTWTPGRAPGQVLDLAVDPGSTDRVVAASDSGLRLSTDAGRTWRRVPTPAIGYLAWPRADRLLLVDVGGTVWQRRGLRGGWRQAGRVDGVPAATSSAPGGVHVALEDGRVLRSPDLGATWTEVGGARG